MGLNNKNTLSTHVHPCLDPCFVCFALFDSPPAGCPWRQAGKEFFRIRCVFSYVHVHVCVWVNSCVCASCFCAFLFPSSTSWPQLLSVLSTTTTLITAICHSISSTYTFDLWWRQSNIPLADNDSTYSVSTVSFSCLQAVSGTFGDRKHSLQRKWIKKWIWII